jgi:hypothetical protein
MSLVEGDFVILMELNQEQPMVQIRKEYVITEVLISQPLPTKLQQFPAVVVIAPGCSGHFPATLF